MKKRDRVLLIALLVLCLVLVISPVIALRGAEFGGSDDAGSEKVSEITSRGQRRCLNRCSVGRFPVSWKACCSAYRPAWAWA